MGGIVDDDDIEAVGRQRLFCEAVKQSFKVLTVGKNGHNYGYSCAPGTP